MGELINGRTPEEIKRILRWINFDCAAHECDSCPNEDICSLQNGNEEVLAKNALDLIEQLEAERDAALAKVPKWISVKERLPKTGDLVLVTISGETCGNKIFNHAYELACYYEDGEDEEGVYHFDGWELWDYRDGEVLNLEVFCWMPLPEPPKEE